jgi:prolyl oligopeptidase family protein
VNPKLKTWNLKPKTQEPERRSPSNRRGGSHAAASPLLPPIALTLIIRNIHTPYLTMANDEDDAVPWQQGIQFFTALRRLGKEAYMFVYNGEKHGLRQRENQKHWTVHRAEYFDYFFKDAPKPDWMEHGVPYLDKGKHNVSVFHKKSTDQ